MFTTRISFKLYLLACLMLCAVSGRALAAEWPETFQGQPDFDFTRSEVVEELKSKEQELGFVPFIATVDDILDARDVNPFRPTPRYSRSQTDAINPFLPTELAEVEGIDLSVEDETLTEAEALDSNFLNTEVELKATGLKVTTDHMKEFEQYLENEARQRIKEAKFLAQQSDIQAAVSRLKLNAISSSPLPYVEINNKRLTPGDTFKLNITAQRKLPDLNAELEALLPASVQTSQKLYDQYQALLKTVIDKVAAEAASEKTTQTQTVTATVTRIEKQTVMLTVNGTEYKLSWRGFF